MNNLTIEQELEALRAENAALKANVPKPKTGLKVTEKGGISMYGLGRFPVTLYRSQWEAVLAKHEELRAFIAENQDKLATKN